ncbi:MAG: hypothetical protein H6907_00395 [Hyphomicrobiales bacterium]|nr:hypothetical protein [Hyphomicrobiales bacterium]MCP5370169.1 hypothetical protein [Hyphomicrobiales bacterium]
MLRRYLGAFLGLIAACVVALCLIALPGHAAGTAPGTTPETTTGHADPVSPTGPT